nr:hypothetical protein TQ38_26495 [Novosphingobium sp. P6W]
MADQAPHSSIIGSIVRLPGWPAATGRLRNFELHPAPGERLAQQNFDLRVDRAQVGRCRPFQRLEQRGIETERESLFAG